MRGLGVAFIAGSFRGNDCGKASTVGWLFVFSF